MEVVENDTFYSFAIASAFYTVWLPLADGGRYKDTRVLRATGGVTWMILKCILYTVVC